MDGERDYCLRLSGLGSILGGGEFEQGLQLS